MYSASNGRVAVPDPTTAPLGPGVDTFASTADTTRSSASWPVTGLLVLFPLWWALGLTAFAFPLFAIPMAWRLRRRRPLALPPWFGLWVIFLLLDVAGLVMLRLDPPMTVPGSAAGRATSLLATFVWYLSATIILLYVGNLTEAELPQHRLIRMLGVLFLVTVAGGLLGLVAPHFGFTSPVEMVLPESVRNNSYVSALVHPSAAQVQTVLGYSAPRPAAPFGYTNSWGNNLSILLVWFVVWAWWRPSLGRRAAALIVLLVALVPVVESLNRGLWLGLSLSALYVVLQLARAGRLPVVLAVAAVAAVAVFAVALSPLGATVSQRIAHPGSNALRSSLTTAAVRGAEQSPIIGWGGTRKVMGSAQSISIGATPGCPQCGNRPIGSNGQLWYVLFSQGFVGAALFVGFFLAAGWRYVRRRDPVSTAAALVLFLAPVYACFYSNLPAALALTFISLALAWRQDMTGETGT
ncbi:MAG: hypothetical protein ACXV3F_10570 [Frankiaceae bacterium]